MTDAELVAELLESYRWQEGVTVDSDGTGPRRHLPLTEKMVQEFNRRLRDDDGE